MSSTAASTNPDADGVAELAEDVAELAEDVPQLAEDVANGVGAGAPKLQLADRVQVAIQWRLRQAHKRVRAERLRAEARAAWYFRHAESRGKRCFVIGNPLVTVPRLSIGDDFLLWSLYRQTHLGGEGNGWLEIGDDCFMNTGAVVLSFEHVLLEDGVALGPEVLISDSDNHPLGDRPLHQAPVVVGEGAWLASRATVLAGVTIGARAVVAAGSVVIDDVAADMLVAGVPARPIRRIQYRPGVRSAWREGGTP